MDTWEEAAAEAADLIYVLPIVRMSEQLHDLTEVDLQLDKRAPNFVAIGSYALEVATVLSDYVTEVEVLKDIYDIVIAKQHDYGHQNILRHGLTGVIVRMCDKVERIRNLEKRSLARLGEIKRGNEPEPREPLNESLFDSWADLVGYSIIAIMLKEGTFELPLAADV